MCLGTGPDGDVFIPLKDLLPMVHPNDIVFDGKYSVAMLGIVSRDSFKGPSKDLALSLATHRSFRL